MAGVPTQSSPSCSWSTSTPQGAGRECSVVFKTLKSVARAVREGDGGTIRRLVINRGVAARIVRSMRRTRASGVIALHVVPSITLALLGRNVVGAGFYLLGRNRAGRIKKAETVYLIVRHGVAYVVHDQPGQDW